jgi:YbbR domain-containing protein
LLGLLLDNYGLKLLSLTFAIALFSLVRSEEDAQRSVYVDVVAVLPPKDSDKILVSALPARVKVTLRGSRSRLAALGRDDVTPLQMDLRDPGKQFYYFDPSSIGVPGPLSVVAIEPASVQLTWRVRGERSLPVEAKLVGTPASGYSARRPVSVDPKTVNVAGPREEVELLSTLQTEEINVEGLSAGVHDRRARLLPLPGHLTYVEQNVVQTRIEIVPEVAERSFAGLEVAVVGPGDVTLRPTGVEVVLRGPAPVVAALTAEQVVPVVTPSPNAPVGSAESLEVSVRGLPDACSVVRIMPSSVLARHSR